MEGKVEILGVVVMAGLVVLVVLVVSEVDVLVVEEAEEDFK